MSTGRETVSGDREEETAVHGLRYAQRGRNVGASDVIRRVFPRPSVDAAGDAIGGAPKSGIECPTADLKRCTALDRIRLILEGQHA